jgi:uncharacterized membrane protein
VSLGPYVWLKWLHVLSSAILLGAGLGTAFMLWSAHRSGKARVVAVVARAITKAGPRFLVPTAVVQLVTGLGLAIVTGIPVNASWLVVSYLLYLVAFACWLSAAVLQVRMRDLAREAASSATPFRYGYYQAMKQWRLIAPATFIVWALIFLMMTAKPKLW